MDAQLGINGMLGGGPLLKSGLIKIQVNTTFVPKTTTLLWAFTFSNNELTVVITQLEENLNQSWVGEDLLNTLYLSARLISVWLRIGLTVNFAIIFFC